MWFRMWFRTCECVKGHGEARLEGARPEVHVEARMQDDRSDFTQSGSL